MPLTFVHVSDMHFGQEIGPAVITHDDVKDRLIDDAERLAASVTSDGASGVIFTGDIAFSGKPAEYEQAGEWLDRLTSAVGCAQADVLLVPGNHDIDRSQISTGCQLMLQDVLDHGEASLDALLRSDADREVLYGRFAGYRHFAGAYSCPLDREGGLASERKMELSPNRSLRFIGLNSALVCSDNDECGRLMLGVRQRVLPREQGDELVVLCHHPLDWLQDSSEARRYVLSRARVFIHGHTHQPSLQPEASPDGSDLLTISAGAAVPPDANDGYGFTYNFITFEWNQATDGLRVLTIPRRWNYATTRFDADTVNYDSAALSVVLRCSNFTSTAAAIETSPTDSPLDAFHAEARDPDPPDTSRGSTMDSASRLLRLRFLRDLTHTQRITVFVKLGILPDSWAGSLTHNMELQLLHTVFRSQRQSELQRAIEAAEAATLDPRVT